MAFFKVNITCEFQGNTCHMRIAVLAFFSYRISTPRYDKHGAGAGHVGPLASTTRLECTFT